MRTRKDRTIRLKYVFIFSLALSRLARLLGGQAVVVAGGGGGGGGGSGVGVGEVAVADGAGFGRDRDVGHLLDDVG